MALAFPFVLVCVIKSQVLINLLKCGSQFGRIRNTINRTGYADNGQRDQKNCSDEHLVVFAYGMKLRVEQSKRQFEATGLPQ
jgi:hypothetical protein